MANHKSALKRARQNAVRRLRNKSVKTRIKTVVNDLHQALAEGNAQAASEKLTRAQSVIDKASKKGVVHTRTASRKISRLSRKISAL